VLQSFHASVDPRALGIEIQAMVAVRLQQHSRDMVTAFQEHVRRLPEMVASYHVSGENDYLIHVAVRDTNHLRETILDAFTALPEVAHVETTLIFDHARAAVLPNYREEAGADS
jgi:DNA-binding Lrp family transcriptional regulator